MVNWHHKRLPELPIISREKPHSGAAARENPWDAPIIGVEPRSSLLQVDSLPSEPPEKPKNTRVGSLSLLQWIYPTQGSNQSLLHCRRILYQLSHQRSPRILGWIAYPFSWGSSPLRNWNGVSCIAGVFFLSWASREVQPGSLPRSREMASKYHMGWERLRNCPREERGVRSYKE